MEQDLTTDEIAAITKEAYVYAFPLLMGYRVAYGMSLQPAAPSYVGPVNAGPYGKAVTLDHRFREVITPNADTPYSGALLDLRAGPLVLTVPEVTDRYYVMQFEDLLGYNELFIGSRATGSSAGSYLLIGPRWDGEDPGGFASSFRFETDFVFLIGRTQLLGPEDEPALAAIMAQYRLEPLEVHQGGDAPALEPLDWPLWVDEASRDERFIGYFNALLRMYDPLHPDEVEMFERFARVGIGRGLSFDSEALDSATRAALAAGVASARSDIAASIGSMGQEIDGWRSSSPFGDRSFYGDDYLKRAGAAMFGWGGNDQVEAHYPIARNDVNGDPLDGSLNYRMSLETRPPVNAFWSLTMYDTSYDGEAGYMVENPIDRYLINATTQGLIEDASGTLSITMQRKEPSDSIERANWLPTPEGQFYVALRMYWPKPAAINGTWNPPPIVRVG